MSEHEAVRRLLGTPRDLAICLVGSVILVAAATGVALATYDPAADSGQRAYIGAVVLTALLALAASVVAHLALSSVRWSLGAAVVVLLAGHLLHVVRLGQLRQRQAPLAEMQEEFLNADIGTRWQFHADPGALVAIRNGRLVIRTAPGSLAYVTVPLPTRTTDLASRRGAWWLPVGLRGGSLREFITWIAAVNMQNQFFVVAQVDRLLLQATPYGLHVTVPQAGGPDQGYEVRHVLGRDGKDHAWRLVRSQAGMELFIDGTSVWRGADLGPFNRVQLGEVRTDKLHGGRLEVERFVYRLGL